MQILTGSCLSAVVHGVDLPKTRLFSFFGSIEGADGDAAFQGIKE